jgi:two-component system LytT family response regulator
MMDTGRTPAHQRGSIRVLIADDEPLARQTLRRLLDADDEVSIVGESAGPETAALVLAHRPDVLLLDVQMPEMSGFEVLDAIPRDALPLVIFITAHSEFAVRAFEEQALDYLLKPFSNRRFYDAIRRVKDLLRTRDAEDAQQRLLAFLVSRPGQPAPSDAQSAALIGVESAGAPADRIALREGGRTLVFRASDIIWIGASGPYADVHSRRGTELVRISLAALEARLDPARFFRIHRSTIVNLDHVIELRHVSHGDYAVLLRDGTTLKGSRARREELELRLGFAT